MAKDILIITYKFPPMGGIGTRRWVKFAKYLDKLGYKVHILTVNYKYVDQANWSHDIGNNIAIHKFKSLFPMWFLSEAKNGVIKQFKRFCNFIFNKTFFYIDSAQYDSKNILKQAKKIIKENGITNIIATGHPVSVNYISTYLKIDNPHLNLIQDFRDNWNDLSNYHYPGGLSFFYQKEKSVYKEFISIYYSDSIINVSDDLTIMVKNRYKSIADKFVTINNGYDPDDFNEVDNANNKNFDIVYTGSLYNQRIEAVNLILDALIELNDKFINKNLKIILYTNFDIYKLNSKYKYLLNRNIFINSFVSPQEVSRVISASTYCLSINSEFASYAFGTKVFDYMALNKKIIHISNGGSLYNLLEDKGQFVMTYNIEKIKKTLLDLKNDYLSKDSDNNVDFKEYSIESLTKELEKLFR
jgi:glycosyltransferase involved in cell wall biosynthesis